MTTENITNNDYEQEKNRFLDFLRSLGNSNSEQSKQKENSTPVNEEKETKKNDDLKKEDEQLKLFTQEDMDKMVKEKVDALNAEHIKELKEMETMIKSLVPTPSSTPVTNNNSGQEALLNRAKTAPYGSVAQADAQAEIWNKVLRGELVL